MISAGDTVKLNSGDPEMVVETMRDDSPESPVGCAWLRIRPGMVYASIERDTFKMAMLTLVTREPPMTPVLAALQVEP
jgi:uncharacterized protein YodC (DUF2158 family)